MIEQRSELDCIGFNVGNEPSQQGRIQLRYRKMTYIDGQLRATDYHRVSIDADTDLDATLDLVASDIEAQGFAAPPISDRPYIDAVTSLAWTPEVKAAVAADRELKREAAEADAAREAEALATDAKARQEQFDAAVAASVARLAKNKP
jgi:hypothetical protein